MFWLWYPRSNWLAFANTKFKLFGRRASFNIEFSTNTPSLAEDGMPGPDPAISFREIRSTAQRHHEGWTWNIGMKIPQRIYSFQLMLIGPLDLVLLRTHPEKLDNNKYVPRSLGVPFDTVFHSWNFHHFHAARLLKVVQAVIRILRYGHGITLKKRIKCFFPKKHWKYKILQTKKLSQEQRVKKGLKKIFIFFFQCENNSQSLVP